MEELIKSYDYKVTFQLEALYISTGDFHNAKLVRKMRTEMEAEAAKKDEEETRRREEEENKKLLEELGL